MTKLPLVCRRLAAVLLLSATTSVLVPLPALAQAAAAPLVTGLPDFTNLIDKVGPAVVNIRTTEKVQRRQQGGDESAMEELLRRFYGIPAPQGRQPGRPAPQPQEQEVDRGVGSGFIISGDGTVLTNAHVIEGASEVIVTLTDRREFKARVVGTDKRSDVAVLKVEGSNLPHLAVGDSGKIRVGEWVIAIGSPFNLDNTVTAGIISAKSRDTGEFLKLIQSDVAVNPGNSGGPLINMRGEVIGINSQIYSLSGGYIGISFAVPIDEVMRIADQLRKTGRVARGRLGVEIGAMSKEVAESLGLGQARGVEVARVEAGGPAEKGGIKVGDIILKFNGVPVEGAGDLPRLVASTPVGSRATVTLWRKGAQQNVPVTIVALEDAGAKKAAAGTSPAGPKPVPNAMGLAVADLGEAQRRALALEGGALVEASEGVAAAAGLRPGDVIVQFNSMAVRDARHFNALVASVDQRRSVALLVRRGDSSQYLVIKPRQ
jgi:serine protease Do